MALEPASSRVAALTVSHGPILVAALAAALFGAAAEATAAEPQLRRSVHSVMGTDLEVITEGGDAASVTSAVQDALVELRRLERIFSDWSDESELASLNAAAGKGPVTVSAELALVLEAGLLAGEETRGAFDVTWAAAWSLWRVDEPGFAPPPDEAVDAVRPFIDFRRVELDRAAGTVVLPAGMRVGLSGIVKGYAVDRAFERIAATPGVIAALVRAGGDLRARGAPGGRPWTIEVKDPARPSRSVGSFEVAGASVSTSGDYERAVELRGVLHHHVLDPRTARPARAGVRAAVVIASRALDSDPLSTGLLVLGVAEAASLLARRPDVEALLIDEEGDLHATSGLTTRLTVQPGRRLRRLDSGAER